MSFPGFGRAAASYEELLPEDMACAGCGDCDACFRVDADLEREEAAISAMEQADEDRRVGL
ncbi:MULTISPECIES: hypothetical protein [Arthrobacter]|uniref:Uncharacterized protein n=1 Tax=Arthrobacter terricola TaxID=2547396 RepID=A0A4R5KMX5_9MICC|nr:MULTISPECIES: hypothetical protein [Arthrobacter]MBT8161024.1 hypothetical protein [Arthrobacter sp. GN70]TDF96886.1 hypothetical protein E1809_09190 [Arthrobacter terricola]